MKRYCLQCDDSTELVHEKRDITISYNGKFEIVSNIDGWHCPICGECEFTNEADSRRHMDTLNSMIESTPRIRTKRKQIITLKEIKQQAKKN